MKIAIIGAGICGLYLAKNLVQKKHTVTVFEAKPNIGKECCSGLFSERLFEFIPEAEPLATNRIDRAIINFPKKSINLRFRHPFFTIEHAQLDLLMAAFATQAGADIRLRETIDDDKLKTIADEFDRTIGCDGALSPTRRFLEFPDPDFMLGIQGLEEKRDNSDTVETWATKNGFIWKIPRGENIEWGIMETQNVARPLFDEFIEKRNIKIGRLKSAIIPQGLILPPNRASLAKGGPRNKKIALCGDASGLTKPWSGGGVIWNLTQAGILLKNFPDFLQYNKEAQRFFGLRVKFGKLAKTSVYAAGFNFPLIIPANLNLDGDFLISKK